MHSIKGPNICQNFSNNEHSDKKMKETFFTEIFFKRGQKIGKTIPGIEAMRPMSPIHSECPTTN